MSLEYLSGEEDCGPSSSQNAHQVSRKGPVQDADNAARLPLECHSLVQENGFAPLTATASNDVLNQSRGSAGTTMQLAVGSSGSPNVRYFYVPRPTSQRELLPLNRPIPDIGEPSDRQPDNEAFRKQSVVGCLLPLPVSLPGHICCIPLEPSLCLFCLPFLRFRLFLIAIKS